jgi:hypothetical protein
MTYSHNPRVPCPDLFTLEAADADLRVFANLVNEQKAELNDLRRAHIEDEKQISTLKFNYDRLRDAFDGLRYMKKANA